MAELKTKKTKESVPAFLSRIEDPEARKDCKTLVGLMQAATGAKAKMWGASIVGFGDYRYRSPATGREGDWFDDGVRAAQGHADALPDVGRLTATRRCFGSSASTRPAEGCLYIKRLADVDGAVLKKLIRESAKTAKMGEFRA